MSFQHALGIYLRRQLFVRSWIDIESCRIASKVVVALYGLHMVAMISQLEVLVSRAIWACWDMLGTSYFLAKRPQPFDDQKGAL